MALLHLESAAAAVPALRPLILVGISLGTAVVWHRHVPGFWRASFRATLTSVVLFYVVALSGLLDLGPFTMHVQYFFLAEVLHTDFLRAFWVSVVVSSLAASFAITVLVGWAMSLLKRRRDLGGSA
jgi:ABC-type Fe3+ transport system permease subunit